MSTRKKSGLKERLLRSIPVLGHYKIEEDIREWDRSIRDEAVHNITLAEDGLMSMLERAVDRRDRDIIAQIERSRKDLHMAKEKVNVAPYGYFPRSSPIKIQEEDLRAMLDIDEEIVDKTRSISEKIHSLSSRFEGRENESLMDLKLLGEDLSSIVELTSKRTLLLRKGSTE